jgi:malate synthase
LLIQTCHRRGAHAMGGMAAQIPIRATPPPTKRLWRECAPTRSAKPPPAMTAPGWRTRADPVAQGVFDLAMPQPNQYSVLREDVHAAKPTCATLLAPSPGSITRAGLLNNLDVCVRYLAAWLDGLGCVPIHHLMEDAATAEISRAQLWQWLHVGGQRLDDGAALDFALFDQLLATVATRLPGAGLPGQARIAEAAQLLGEMIHAGELADFLTLPAYERLD